MKSSSAQENPLGILPMNQLLTRFVIPGIVAMLISALYSTVDRFYIGRSVGMLGNTATNVALPLTTTCTAISLMYGTGGAANFNLSLDSGEKGEATRYADNAVFMLTVIGILLCLAVKLFLKPLMIVFEVILDILDYSLTRISIASLGFLFLILTTDGFSLIRADGNPRFSMMCTLTGAVLNTILGPLFVFGFHAGTAGAALTTTIGQVISDIMVIIYLTRFKAMRLSLGSFVPALSHMKAITALDMAPFFNQMAMTVVQTVMNNIFRYYGTQSHYGSEIPLACAGIITEMNMILFSLVIGLSQGLQPTVSFNYGTRKSKRVQEAYPKAALITAMISTLSFLYFQLILRQIISIFGSGSEEYFHFAEQYFRIFLPFTFLSGLQPITANYFTSIGKAAKGIFISLIRQIIFLLPLIVVLPMFLGIGGMMYSAPVVDLMTALLALVFVTRESHRMRGMKEEMDCGAETVD